MPDGCDDVSVDVDTEDGDDCSDKCCDAGMKVFVVVAGGERWRG